LKIKKELIMSNINVILNGKIVKGTKGETILSVARKHGFEIPTLCNDDRLEPYSSCYVCVVEIEGMRGLQPACSTIIAEGMKIETNNGKIAVTTGLESLDQIEILSGIDENTVIYLPEE